MKKYLLILIILILGYTIYKSYTENQRIYTELYNTRQEFEKISDTVGNLTRKYISQKQLNKKLKEDWSKEKSKLNGRIKILSNATFLIREKARESNKSDIIYAGSKLKYVVNEIKYENGPPVGYVLIFDNGRVISKLYNHEINIKTAISRDENVGTYDILTKADYVLKTPHISKPNWLNKPYPLKIKNGTAFIDPSEKKGVKSFCIGCYKLGLSTNFTTNKIKHGINLSLAGYGYSKRDLDYKFVQLGLDYSEIRKTGITFSPILFRPFKNQFSNTYIGPGIGSDSLGSYYYLGLQVDL